MLQTSGNDSCQEVRDQQMMKPTEENEQQAEEASPNILQAAVQYFEEVVA